MMDAVPVALNVCIAKGNNPILIPPRVSVTVMTIRNRQSTRWLLVLR